MPLSIAAKLQQLAAHPYHSAWVAASAGSGKTKVLTDRVLNLLLEGCLPERILCLTFTKAAAAEMANRVRARLGEWAILSDQDLRDSLEALQGTFPSSEKIERARSLFGLTLDTPGGLKIQTIHSFCQSLLKRFPLEAEISPFFEVLDETQQQILIKKASQKVMEDTSLQNALSELTLRFNELTLEECNAFILQERGSFEGLVPAEIDKVLGTQNLKKEEILYSLIHNIPHEQLEKSLFLFEEGSPTDQERGIALSHFLKLSQREKLQNYESYLSVFLTQKGEKRSRLVTKKISSKSPTIEKLFEEEASRLERWLEKYNALEISHISKAFLCYSLSFLKAYEDLKNSESLLDYEDLILKALSLLRDPGCHWVLYKLDGGLDHILVDEAQDTNPAQWQIICTIAEEFYANAATDLRNRTLFIVGDEKQSIYSFQGADPAIFAQMQQDLRAFAQASGKPWKDIDLNISFRSTPEVLATVDAVFSSCSLSSMPLQHLPFRKEAPGHVEVWPLIKAEEEELLEPWQLSFDQAPQDPPQKRLARHIAEIIRNWLFNKGPLSRPIGPGDILILVRRRTAFVDTLIRALKDVNVPVAGIDRLWLLEGIGVQDLLKLAEFLLLPDDDLTLATVLKGPLFGLSEEDLYTLAYNRGDASLWQRLHEHTKFSDIVGLLEDLLSQVDVLTPYALFSYILGPLKGREKWHARLGAEVLDSLDEFLNLCLLFQRERIPSLQIFLDWVSQEIIELKRDLEQSNMVRVMTVHGSKGLQAPIVFLPDTTQPPKDLPPFVFFEKAFLWVPPMAKDISLTRRIKQNLREKQQEEYKRLLYVALTRAEDALYICGWEGDSQETWYDFVVQGLQKIGQEVEFDFSSTQGVKGKGWLLSSAKESTAPLMVREASFYSALPSWLGTLPPLEESLKILHPSQGETESIFYPSSLGDFGTERGILIHKLLDILSEIPEEKREGLALCFLAKEGVDKNVALEIIPIVQNVFRSFPDLFGPQSRGEVPFVGYVGGNAISGQIDRLIVSEDYVLLVDFKTHLYVPERLEEISPLYLTQMAFYKLAMSHIFPDKSILCGLLWTQVPRLDLLPEPLLKKFEPSIDGINAQAYTKKINAS